MLTVNFEKCTGCGACVQRCPAQCISWIKKEFGFRYPKIDETSCVHCELCERVCPIEKPVVALQGQKVYAAVHKDAQVLEKSTSGGAFTAIADVIFDHGGVVYGVAMQKDMQVRHIRIESRSDLDQVRGSKYVQSDTAETYRQAEEDLKSGKTVLYTGTPCQIHGLKCFLTKEYENLYTVDIVCHGVGSQAYFDRYMEFAGKRYGEIKELRFRAKKFSGWSCGGVVSISSGDGTFHDIPYRDFDNYYYAYFLSGDIYRSSCYTCKYASTNRPGDFTLGDYWGVEALRLPLGTERGCSLLLANNRRGERLMQQVDDLRCVETSLEQATYCNRQLKKPSQLTNTRKRLLDEFESTTSENIQKMYCKTHRKAIIKGWLKALVPYKLRLIIRSKRK